MCPSPSIEHHVLRWRREEEDEPEHDREDGEQPQPRPNGPDADDQRHDGQAEQDADEERRLPPQLGDLLDHLDAEQDGKGGKEQEVDDRPQPPADEAGELLDEPPDHRGPEHHDDDQEDDVGPPRPPHHEEVGALPDDVEHRLRHSEPAQGQQLEEAPGW
jgi:hypothetical protein